MPTTAFYISGDPLEVALMMPSHFTIESTDAITHTAPNDPYTVTLQIWDANSVTFDTGSDTIVVTFTHTDSEGGEVVTLTTPATHLSSGLYSASVTPTVLGAYTVTVTMTIGDTATSFDIPTEVSGSPFTVTVIAECASGEFYSEDEIGCHACS